MSKLIGLAFGALLLLPSMHPVREQFAKYKAVEGYEVRPGVLLIPTYSADGQICEIGLEKLHYSPEMIRLDSSLSRKEIDQIFDELVPADERGPRSKDFEGTLITQSGGSLTTSIFFENVSIQIYGDTSPAVGKGGITVEKVAATLKWKTRRCQAQANSPHPEDHGPYQVQMVEDYKSWHYLLPLFASLLIAAGGVIASVIAWSQSRIARRSADAARDSANAIIGVERAWVLVTKSRQGDVGFVWRIKNFGRTPARIVSIEWGAYNLAPDDVFPNGSVLMSARIASLPSILAPEDEWKFAEFEPEKAFAALWPDVVDNRRNLYFSCLIKYKDVLRESQILETEYTAVYTTTGAWGAVDSPEHNRNT